MPLKVGDRVPDATFKVMTKDGPANMTSAEVFNGKKVAAFAVPGAFTPTCHNKHLPNFIENLDALKAKGVDTVACIAVNDPFVLSAWAKATNADGKIVFLSDGNAEFTKAAGFDFDGSGANLGTRSRRYAMLVDDGVVKVLNLEDGPGKAEASSAQELLKAL